MDTCVVFTYLLFFKRAIPGRHTRVIRDMFSVFVNLAQYFSKIKRITHFVGKKVVQKRDVFCGSVGK